MGAVNPAPFPCTQDLTKWCPWAQGCGGSEGPHRRGGSGAPVTLHSFWGKVAREWDRGKGAFERERKECIFYSSGLSEGEEHRAQVDTLPHVLPYKLPKGLPWQLSGKESACIAGDWARFLGGEDPLEEGMATHSRILACRIPRTEEPARVGHDLVTKPPPKGLNLFKVVKEKHSYGMEVCSGGCRKEGFLHVKGVRAQWSI